MTKQEAKDLFRDCKSDFIIEKLYQYFTERSCDSCVYDYCGCPIQDSILRVDYLEEQEETNFSDFYCNSYKRKIDIEE